MKFVEVRDLLASKSFRVDGNLYDPSLATIKGFDIMYPDIIGGYPREIRASANLAQIRERELYKKVGLLGHQAIRGEKRHHVLSRLRSINSANTTDQDSQRFAIALAKSAHKDLNDFHGPAVSTSVFVEQFSRVASVFRHDQSEVLVKELLYTKELYISPEYRVEVKKGFNAILKCDYDHSGEKITPYDKALGLASIMRAVATDVLNPTGFTQEGGAELFEIIDSFSSDCDGREGIDWVKPLWDRVKNSVTEDTSRETMVLEAIVADVIDDRKMQGHLASKHHTIWEREVAHQ